MCQNDSHDLTLLGIWVSFPILDQAICLTCKNSAGIHWKAILASTSFALCYHYSSINLRNCYLVLQFKLYIPWGQHMLYLFFFSGINYCSTFRLSAEQTFWIDLPVVLWRSPLFIFFNLFSYSSVKTNYIFQSYWIDTSIFEKNFVVLIEIMAFWVK